MGNWMDYLMEQELLHGAVPNALQQQVLEAQDWRDLEAVILTAEAAYQRGEMTASTVEQIAVLVNQKSRELPVSRLHVAPDKPTCSYKNSIIG